MMIWDINELFLIMTELSYKFHQNPLPIFFYYLVNTHAAKSHPINQTDSLHKLNGIKKEIIWELTIQRIELLNYTNESMRN